MNNTELINQFQEGAQKAIEHLAIELGKIRTGRAHTSLVENILVEQYGATLPLNQVATIGIPDSRTISIQPWDKNTIKDIEKAIHEAQLGITPNNNGERILLSMPSMTEETRKEYAKMAKHKTEEAKIALRNVREQIIHDFKQENEESSRDDEHDFKEQIQKHVDDANKEAENMFKQKEDEIMTI